jgi:hypothetical protein
LAARNTAKRTPEPVIGCPVGGYDVGAHGPQAWAADGIPATTDFVVALRTHTLTFGLSFTFGGLGAPPVAN